MRCLLLLALAPACKAPRAVPLGEFTITWQEEGAGLSIERGGQEILEVRGISLGTGSAEVDFAAGSYLFEDEELDLEPVASLEVRKSVDGVVFAAQLLDAAGRELGELQLGPGGPSQLNLTVQATDPEHNRRRLELGCLGGEHFLGGGAHAMDVEHAGEAFALWVSEPGVGKVDSEDPPDDWFVRGTRHASSYPDPFFLRPESPVGVEAVTGARVEAELCVDGDTWSLLAWEGSGAWRIVGGDTPLEVVRHRTQAVGLPPVAPDHALSPWNDGVRGTERVLEVARLLRESGASSSAIWTEDFKGAEDKAFGYHIKGGWEVDPELYPEVEQTAAELEDLGFHWQAYFSPFVEEDTPEWDEVSDHLIATAEGVPYSFTSALLTQVSVLDLSDPGALSWAASKMELALDQGFDGWMADYAEWLPPDADLAAMDAMADHNHYPALWQQLNASVLEGRDATFFVRSGWSGTSGLAPVVWAGDQRTSFDTDDGLPTVVPMGIGMGISGVALFAHDISGYQSVGNAPSTKELWFRWCSLGAFSPVMRTHHGAFAEDNWQFDSDAETLAFYAEMSREHARLFPYLRGLLAQASEDGTPLVLHPALLFDEVDWGAMDAWMLGPALYVAPVLEAGATSRLVELPGSLRWFDWFTGEERSSGTVAAEPDQIPVFAAEGSLVPTLTVAPDTFLEAAGAEWLSLAEADLSRTVYVFGSGGSFVEADGTRWTATGEATSAGEATETLSSGTIAVNGLRLEVEAPLERTVRVVVWP